MLIAVAAACGYQAIAAERDAQPEPFPVGPAGTASLATPILSARRVPEQIAVPAAEEALAAELATVVSSLPPQTCLVVEHADRRVFEMNPTSALVPASIQKLLTASAVLVSLGPDFRFVTTASGLDSIDDGVLESDLWLVGGGDPVLATADYVAAYEEEPIASRLETLADALVSAGLTEVRGGVRGDDSRYDLVRYLEVWPERYIEQNQTGPLSALTVNDGFVEFPEQDLVRSLSVATEDPPVHAAATLDDLLEARGVTIAGSPASGAPPAGAVELARLESAPLAEIVADMLSASDNATAELLLKELGRATSGGGTTAAGVEAVAAWAAAAVGDPTGLVVADGSGLAVENNVSCGQLAVLLDEADPASAVVTGLAVAGERGTLRNRYDDTDMAGRLRAKTGSLRDATALAGFVDTPSGDHLTFAFIVNREAIDVVSEALPWQDAVVAPLGDYPAGVDLVAIGPQDPVG